MALPFLVPLLIGGGVLGAAHAKNTDEDILKGALKGMALGGLGAAGAGALGLGAAGAGTAAAGTAGEIAATEAAKTAVAEGAKTAAAEGAKTAAAEGLTGKQKALIASQILNSARGEQAPPPVAQQYSFGSGNINTPSVEQQIATTVSNPTFVPRGLFEEGRNKLDEERLMMLQQQLNARGLA